MATKYTVFNFREAEARDTYALNVAKKTFAPPSLYSSVQYSTQYDVTGVGLDVADQAEHCALVALHGAKLKGLKKVVIFTDETTQTVLTEDALRSSQLDIEINCKVLPMSSLLERNPPVSTPEEEFPDTLYAIIANANCVYIDEPHRLRVAVGPSAIILHGAVAKLNNSSPRARKRPSECPGAPAKHARN